MGVLSQPLLSRLRKIRHNRRLVLFLTSLFLTTTLVLCSRGPSAALVPSDPPTPGFVPRPPPEPVPLDGPPVVINSQTSPPPHPPLASWTPVPQEKQAHDPGRAHFAHSSSPPPPENSSVVYDGHGGHAADAPSAWLIGINTAVPDFARRATIRSTWINFYRDRVPFHHVFFVANPGAQATSTTKATGWAERIAAENATHGDLVVLDNIPDDDFTARTVQPLEFFGWAARHRARAGYRFVTKIESDVMLNARGLWDRYIGQWLHDDYAQRTILGQRIVSGRAGGGDHGQDLEVVHTHAMMYTLGWDLMVRLATLYDAATVNGTRLAEREDVAPALLLTQARERYRVVSLTLSEAFSYWDADCRGDGTPWARRGSPLAWAWHALRPTALVVGNLRTEKLYRKLSSWFDADGVRTMTPVRGWRGERVALWMQVVDLLWRFGLVGQEGVWDNAHAPQDLPEVQPWQSPWKVREINGMDDPDPTTCEAWSWCRGY